MRAARLDPFASRLLAIHLKNSDRPTQSATESAGTDLGGALPLEARTETLAGQATAELLVDEMHHAVAPTDCQTCGVHETPQGEMTLQELTSELVSLKARMEDLEQRLLDVESDGPVYR
jgi:hypothetical protein